MTSQIRLILVDPQRPLCEAWLKAFRGLPNVEIAQGYFEKLPAFDCMVSAANSFGLMDGGVDGAITNFFGQQLMERVQERILREYRGEQPIGTSMIIETGHELHPYIAHTPTMRVPMSIAETDNVYTAMWAMLLAVDRHNQTVERQIETIACPGLGTATGRVSVDKAAAHMALAYRRFLDPPTEISWEYAGQRHFQVEHWQFIRE
jgi:O-acetyl-ADP-ribose deacetylase (regulator of RNase III)